MKQLVSVFLVLVILFFNPSATLASTKPIIANETININVPCENVNYTVLEGRELQKAKATALKNSDVKILRDFVISKGYRPFPDGLFGIKTNEGFVVTLAFEDTAILSKNAAFVVYSNMNGEEKIEAAFMDNSGKLPVFSHYQVVDDGSIVASSSYFDCLWRCVLGICAPGAVACGWAGPSFLKCAAAVCGTGVLVCGIICIGQ